MKMSEEKVFWFLVGSQELYGEEALKKVQSNAQTIVDTLNKEGSFPFKIQLKDELAISQDIITSVMKEANYKDEVQGVITWMHTFSPAKMWIRGTKILQKPLLHFVTQFNNHIPWETIDMDYMNLHQSAHGDREYGYINERLNKNNEVIVGHWQEKEIQEQIGRWMNVAYAYNESFNIKVARFGDNMRNVAVTEGDKIEAQIQLGWTVDYFGIGDLTTVINKVSNNEIEHLFEQYKELYDFDYGKYEVDEWESSVKEQIKYEIGIKQFLDEGGYTAFTTNFEDLYGMEQLPGLAVQRLNEQGYGFAGEGDWKTAALDRLLKVMSHNKQTGFMEDYTYEMRTGQEAILGSHMLEVDPTLAETKPKVVVNPLGIGGKNDPARLVFDGKAGEGVVVSISDMGTNFRMLINEVESFVPEEEAPNLPVARVIWKVKPDFKNGIKEWIKQGGGHHTVISLSLTKDQVITLATLFNLEYVLIN
ncbi:L-arabinose isomerase [Mammaliicoccus fleurettii]|uniref:L-arabinose isomerase n=1 Tax=Mammaliicoccus fleurettii TaxID=150056 RepID=UPI000E1B55FD|nr:L-arabinose isomerase [Mammaliicoccus fleurettii]RIL52926.1 L-arabinose isomerase [Mammaliicoccus fleurettii]RTX92108.1 L-arabinose isomerase [Mammaliicoccus fleurettii]HCN59515.1 L-arabinose isomerase [Staphylococcus sp.]